MAIRQGSTTSGRGHESWNGKLRNTQAIGGTTRERGTLARGSARSPVDDAKAVVAVSKPRPLTLIGNAFLTAQAGLPLAGLGAIARVASILGPLLTLTPSITSGQRYVEISAEIDTTTYHPSAAGAASNAVHRRISFTCTTNQ